MDTQAPPVKTKRVYSEEAKLRMRSTKWQQHLREFRAAHPEIKGREVFIKAKESYSR